MQKKKLLVITPDTPHPSYIESIISPLGFLGDDFIIHPLDSLTFMNDCSNEEYYQLWQEELKKYIDQYDAFFGFSFGGVILQQCFSLFVNLSKPIVLFSTPTFANNALRKKLGQVISLCKEHKIEEALRNLYHHVYYPGEIPERADKIIDNELAIQRVIFGLNRVLETDSRTILKECEVPHLHLIGARSDLVNRENVITTQKGILLQVPDAGMRVLRDNPSFCRKAILETLDSEV